MNKFLADVIVAVHLAYVSFVFFGLFAIWLGVLLKWEWVRNPWFRWIHLAMIAIVAFEAVADIECPLTTWENRLRRVPVQWWDQLDCTKTVGLLASPMGDGSLLAATMLHDWRAPKIDKTFVSRCLDAIMFPPVELWMFTPIYVTFALLVAGTLWLAPPRSIRRKPLPA